MIDLLRQRLARYACTDALQEEHALKERYLKEFLAVLPAKVVARFYQVENRINNLVDLELSEQLRIARITQVDHIQRVDSLKSY